MALLDSIQSFLTRSPADVMQEQMRKLYLRLYPYIAQDFLHQEDARIASEATFAQLELLAIATAAHVHASPGAPSGVMVPSNPAVVTLPTAGLALILAVGTPQPTGEGMALLPSRVSTPVESVALPPLSPAEFIG